MCGIAGFLDNNVQQPGAVLSAMTDAIIHRGPDDAGHWHDREAGVSLGHRRLAILDLSPAGHQPMCSASGRFVVAFNGEIYNHNALRADLERIAPCSWRGHSDTEVMLEAFDAWGVEGAVSRFTGMFAIALWDCKERELHLIRDRVGEKPLYYGACGGGIAFASELKSIKAHPGFRGEINRDALALYMRYCYVPAPYCIYRGIQKVLPGTIVTIKREGHSPRIGDPVPYWSMQQAALDGAAAQFAGNDQEAVGALENLLMQAIGDQMCADVPLGAFLSGGIDSSAVVSLMQRQSVRPIRTFTIGFHSENYNEAVHAKEVARHLGTEHTELYVSPQDALAVIPKLPVLYDEPFGDSSKVPTYLVSEMTRRHVTVSLSGDAGDELFGGYNRYTWVKRIWDRIGWLPHSVREVAARALLSASPATWDRVFRSVAPLLPSNFRLQLPGDKIHKLAGVLSAQSPVDMYRLLTSTWKDPAGLVLGASEPGTPLTDSSRLLADTDLILQMIYLDLLTYLPDDILVKVDRAAMGVSLETRVPFLDHRVIEFAWRLPLSLKVRKGQGKWILRQVLYKHVPQRLLERPKMGFGIPIDMWLREPLRDWAESLLDESRLKADGYLDPRPVRQKWKEHIAGHRNWAYHLWNVLMFQAWLDHEQKEGIL